VQRLKHTEMLGGETRTEGAEEEGCDRRLEKTA
jgi:hypothetical protein